MMRLTNGVAKRSAAHCLRKTGVQQRRQAVKGLRPCFCRCAPYAPSGDRFPPLLRGGFQEGNGLLDLSWRRAYRAGTTEETPFVQEGANRWMGETDV